MGYPFGPYLRLLLLTAQRKSEVALMKWADVDLDCALWTLLREATKADRVHDVPLSRPAVELLESLPRFDGAYVLSSTSGRKPINSFSKAQARLAAEIQNRRRESGQDKPLAHWRLHDLRRTSATHMAGAGVPPPCTRSDIESHSRKYPRSHQYLQQVSVCG